MNKDVVFIDVVFAVVLGGGFACVAGVGRRGGVEVRAFVDVCRVGVCAIGASRATWSWLCSEVTVACFVEVARYADRRVVSKADHTSRMKTTAQLTPSPATHARSTAHNTTDIDKNADLEIPPPLHYSDTSDQTTRQHHTGHNIDEDHNNPSQCRGP